MIILTEETMDLNAAIKSEFVAEPMEHVHIKSEVIDYDEISVKHEEIEEEEVMHHHEIKIKQEDPIDVAVTYSDSEILNKLEIKIEATQIVEPIQRFTAIAYECYICKLSKRSVHSLRLHMNKHQTFDPRVCTVCGKRCASACDLRRHMAFHSDEKNVACEVCEKRFKTNDCLKQHMRIHGDKQFACTICSQILKTRNGLKIHIMNHQGHTPFQCKICPFKCTNSGRLLYHIRSNHTGEKAFSCTICSKRFSNSGNLAVHRRIHSGKEIIDLR